MAGEPLCQDLRGLVHDCLAKHLYESAAFYADKLVTLSDGTPADVYVLAQVRALAGLATRIRVLQHCLRSCSVGAPATPAVKHAGAQWLRSEGGVRLSCSALSGHSSGNLMRGTKILLSLCLHALACAPFLRVTPAAGASAASSEKNSSTPRVRMRFRIHGLGAAQALFIGHVWAHGLGASQALYMGRQWRRALALLRSAGLVEADVRGRYLAARCLKEVSKHRRIKGSHIMDLCDQLLLHCRGVQSSYRLCCGPACCAQRLPLCCNAWKHARDSGVRNHEMRRCGLPSCQALCRCASGRSASRCWAAGTMLTRTPWTCRCGLFYSCSRICHAGRAPCVRVVQSQNDCLCNIRVLGLPVLMSPRYMRHFHWASKPDEPKTPQAPAPHRRRGLGRTWAAR